MRFLIILTLGLLLSCGVKESDITERVDPLVFDAGEVARADTLAVLVPGALATRDIFAPAEDWARTHGYAIAFYRFPGLDGLALDHELIIEDAATRIAEFANAHPGKKIRLLGYSTGGPIAISAADQIDGDVKVAAMSSAVEKGGGPQTAWRSGRDIAAASLRARSIRMEQVWFQYYRTLLFGRAGLSDPSKQAIMDRITEQEKDRIVLPRDGIGDAHARDLGQWTLRKDHNLDPAKLRFFVGGNDPVFRTAQTQRFAGKLGGPEITVYPEHGHLLFLTEPRVFEDILAFFEAP